MKLKPLGDRLIVRAIDEEETTASGLVLPDTAKEKPQKGEVLAAGDGKINEDTGKRTPLDVDTVLKARGQPGMDEQFADFVAANALIGQNPDAKLAYAATRLYTR